MTTVRLRRRWRNSSLISRPQLTLAVCATLEPSERLTLD